MIEIPFDGALIPKAEYTEVILPADIYYGFYGELSIDEQKEGLREMLHDSVDGLVVQGFTHYMIRDLAAEPAGFQVYAWKQ